MNHRHPLDREPNELATIARVLLISWGAICLVIWMAW